MQTGGIPTVDMLPQEIWDGELLDGKYRFERPLASSSMAIVVIARHIELDERVAIKFLSPHAVRSSSALARFRREARAAAQIKNQHVVRIIDVATTQTSVPYIVMEYLDGMDLERQLSLYPDRKAPIHDAVDFVLQASEAIAEGHQLGIVHRDLKPANLFCSDRGDGYPMIKVLDFGISKVRTAIGDVDRTDQHEILGSPRFMSPEQIDSSRDVDLRTDIWSLGVILYEALSGTAPFNAETIPELWRRIRSESPPELRRFRPECPYALAEVIARCLQKEPANRYADLGELATALAPIAPERSRASIARIKWTMVPATSGSTRPSTVAIEYGQVTTARTIPRRPWLFAVGTIAAIIAGIGTFAMGPVLWKERGSDTATVNAPISVPSVELQTTPQLNRVVEPTAAHGPTVSIVEPPATSVLPGLTAPRLPASTAKHVPVIASTATSDSTLSIESAERAEVAASASPNDNRQWRVPPVEKRK